MIYQHMSIISSWSDLDCFAYTVKLENSVNKGIARLTEHFKGLSWLYKIDLNDLEMYDCFNCILGQIFRDEDGTEAGFDIAVKAMNLTDEEIEEMGFCLEQELFLSLQFEDRRLIWHDLTAIWSYKLQSLRANP